MSSPEIPQEELLYYSFSLVFDARLATQQNNQPAADELKALEDHLWRLFIRNAYRDHYQACRCESAA